MDPSDPSDAIAQTVELVRLAQGGDDRAFGELIERYLPRVETIVRARLGPGLRRELESGDVVQETLIEVLRNFDHFELRDERSFVRWVSTIVENRLRQDARFFGALRRDRRRDVELGGEGAGATADPSDGAEGPSTLAEKGELLERARVARAALSPRHIEVLDRRDAGESWATVAADMGLASADAARMLHARARTALLHGVVGDRGSG
ncbi:RNA polymerase sigma factor [Engelhardtia mirabilis]|uniref:RNA polymerase sigma factor RpoE n=1 Tax=Engelhardtia mirabilis TaxID=2528011 RepID=A0A518BN53_9BACT|nr:RNA polymerase sigma factor RpoE [Planctomycetes bacterium Pla133]QDV02735.1 RNA polymerase sigma factor RpoE [Planctomycetes bacterium Pla86]